MMCYITPGQLGAAVQFLSTVLDQAAVWHTLAVAHSSDILTQPHRI